MNFQLIPPRSLFGFLAPCRQRQPIWSAKGAELDESYRLPELPQLEGGSIFADVRAAWHEQGLAFSVRVAGKRRAPFCDERRLTDSDGAQFWIDARNTRNVHRASRFCHRFVVLPAGGGPKRDQPIADQLLINRARENARPVRPGDLKCRNERRVDGYLVELFVPAAALTGYEPSEYPQIGFTYAVFDQEFGEQAFTVGGELPYDEDPSLWATLELVK